MRTNALVLATAATLLSITAAFADDAQQGATLQQVSAISQDRVICHHMIFEGRLLEATECRTQRQWDAVRHTDEQNIRRYQLRSLVVNNR